MKTLKTTTAAVILLFALTGTQTAQAQTKEETIAWLLDYGDKLLENTSYKIENVDETCITLEYRYYGSGIIARRHYKVDFKSIFLQDVKYDGNSVVIFTQPNAVVNIPLDHMKWEKYNNSQIILSSDDYVSKEKVTRVVKAILHLAKLSGAKELPKVTENTF